MNKIDIQATSIADINKRKKYYVIPEYQRLYVWQKENIEKFFNDILSAFLENQNQYFIGIIIF